MLTLKDFGSISPTFVANVPVKKSPKFLFVSITNPDDIKNPTKQITIRRHAKRDANRAKNTRQNSQFKRLIVQTTPNKAVVPRSSVPYNPSAPQQRSEQQWQQADTVDVSSENPPVIEQDKSPESLNTNFNSLAFLRPLGAGRGLNPFAPYPVEPNSRTVQLLDYSQQVGELQHHPMRAIWITIGMSDTSAFHLTLSSASLTLAQKCNQAAGETTESINYYTTAAHTISERLQDPVDSTSDGVVGTILGFACLDNTVGNWERWQLHMNGLQKVLELRGGIESLQTSHILQVTAFWVDVTGSLIQDTIPRFPIPNCALADPEPHRSPRIIFFSQKWNTKFPDLWDISDGLTSLASLTGYVNNQKKKNLLCHGEFFNPINVYPVAHKFLSMSRYAVAAEINMSSSGLIIREILRLTSLLFFGLVKEKCGVFPSGVPENEVRLARLITDIAVNWSSFMDLALWVLTVSALAEEGDRSWYVSQISVAMASLGLAGWDDALKMLKELIWIDELLDEAANILGMELLDFQLALDS
ncbi:hypothetical protein B7463_g11997, partial [Scytalidium lignicola]